ncbi:unnamed protein product, partial [Oppiella nova]
MSRVVYILSQIPQLYELTAKALANCRVINIRLTQYPGEFSLGLQIGAQEIADLQEAEILFGDPNLLAQTFHRLPRIQWIQSTWAGIDWYVEALTKSGQKPPSC